MPPRRLGGIDSDLKATVRMQTVVRAQRFSRLYVKWIVVRSAYHYPAQGALRGPGVTVTSGGHAEVEKQREVPRFSLDQSGEELLRHAEPALLVELQCRSG